MKYNKDAMTYIHHVNNSHSERWKPTKDHQRKICWMRQLKDWIMHIFNALEQIRVVARFAFTSSFNVLETCLWSYIQHDETYHPPFPLAISSCLNSQMTTFLICVLHLYGAMIATMLAWPNKTHLVHIYDIAKEYFIIRL